MRSTFKPMTNITCCDVQALKVPLYLHRGPPPVAVPLEHLQRAVDPPLADEEALEVALRRMV